MSTDHFEDIDHDQPDGIAAAFRETAFSFEAPASAVLHAGALAHARRHRRRSAAAGTLAAVAAVGVAGAVVTQIPSYAGASTTSSVGPGTAGVTASSSTPSPSPSHSTSPAAVAPTHVTAAEGKALANLVLDTALGALPPGSHPVNTGFGAGGTKIPNGKNLPVNGAPADLLGLVNGTWNMGTADGPGVGVSVAVRTDALSCQKMKLSPQDVCTIAPFAKGGELVTHESRKDPVNQTGPYFLSYVWLRPDGADIAVDMVEPSPSQFALTSDQANTLLAAPGWDQAVTKLKALVADAANVPGS
ncbi:hypothetical protein [Catenulispora pinisilvae]|uniref:hypothetical protein n=1 Tax=Catenulispora pinisilvae TaxID=2705253 RepID=UPI001891762F|nr:hypothetical protein [Catenulispora pinisilvae]